MDVAQDTGPRECTLFASHGSSFTRRYIGGFYAEELTNHLKIHISVRIHFSLDYLTNRTISLDRIFQSYVIDFKWFKINNSEILHTWNSSFFFEIKDSLKSLRNNIHCNFHKDELAPRLSNVRETVDHSNRFLNFYQIPETFEFRKKGKEEKLSWHYLRHAWFHHCA